MTNRHGAINKNGVLINKNADSLPKKDWDLPHENKDSTMKRLVSIGFKKTAICSTMGDATRPYGRWRFLDVKNDTPKDLVGGFNPSEKYESQLG